MRDSRRNGTFSSSCRPIDPKDAEWIGAGSSGGGRVWSVDVELQADNIDPLRYLGEYARPRVLPTELSFFGDETRLDSVPKRSSWNMLATRPISRSRH